MKIEPKTYNEYILTADEAVTVFRALEYTNLKHQQGEAGHIASMHVERLLKEFKDALGY